MVLSLDEQIIVRYAIYILIWGVFFILPVTIFKIVDSGLQSKSDYDPLLMKFIKEVKFYVLIFLKKNGSNMLICNTKRSKCYNYNSYLQKMLN